jgi:hypothetical protein
MTMPMLLLFNNDNANNDNSKAKKVELIFRLSKFGFVSIHKRERILINLLVMSLKSVSKRTYAFYFLSVFFLGKKFRIHLYSPYRYMLNEELIHLIGDENEKRNYLKFYACDDEGNLHFLCLVVNCFCEFDNNATSIKYRNSHTL